MTGHLPVRAEGLPPVDVDEGVGMRRLMGEVIKQVIEEPEHAMDLLVRVEKALWAAALGGSTSADRAKAAFKEGVQTFLEG